MMMNILALDYGPDLINDVANQYINAINSGFGLIKGDVTWLLNVLIILSIMWSAALWAMSDDHIIVQFARKIVYIGLFAWIIQNWQKLTDTLARSKRAASTARPITRSNRETSPTWATQRPSPSWIKSVG
jgi:type IV secretory pathway TrbL component